MAVHYGMGNLLSQLLLEALWLAGIKMKEYLTQQENVSVRWESKKASDTYTIPEDAKEGLQCPASLWRCLSR